MVYNLYLIKYTTYIMYVCCQWTFDKPFYLGTKKSICSKGLLALGWPTLYYFDYFTAYLMMTSLPARDWSNFTALAIPTPGTPLGTKSQPTIRPRATRPSLVIPSLDSMSFIRYISTWGSCEICTHLHATLVLQTVEFICKTRMHFLMLLPLLNMG